MWTNWFDIILCFDSIFRGVFFYHRISLQCFVCRSRTVFFSVFSISFLSRQSKNNCLLIKILSSSKVNFWHFFHGEGGWLVCFLFSRLQIALNVEILKITWVKMTRLLLLLWPSPDFYVRRLPYVLISCW